MIFLVSSVQLLVYRFFAHVLQPVVQQPAYKKNKILRKKFAFCGNFFELASSRRVQSDVTELN